MAVRVLRLVAMAGAVAVLAAAGVLAAAAWAGSTAVPVKTTTKKATTTKKTTTTTKKTTTTTKKATTTTAAKTKLCGVGQKSAAASPCDPNPILAADACTKLVGPRIKALTGVAMTAITVTGAGVAVECNFDVGGAYAFSVSAVTKANAVNYTQNMYDSFAKGAVSPAAVCYATASAANLQFPSDVPFTAPRVVSSLGDYGFLYDVCPTHTGEFPIDVFAATKSLAFRVQAITQVAPSITDNQTLAVTRWVIAQLATS